MLSYQKGILISWNDDRGFGFIEPENKSKKVFIHISALKKHGRRPQEGDTIYYQLDFDTQNRIQASRAYIEGVVYPKKPAKQKRAEFHARKKNTRSRLLPVSIAIIIIIVIGGVQYFKQNRTYQESISSTSVQSLSSDSHSGKYQCRGKTRCSEMTSCEEAKFYLKNCPDVEIDGDGDGIPCESQWCGS